MSQASPIFYVSFFTAASLPNRKKKHPNENLPTGNIILTDYKYEILDLLRTHTYDGRGDAGGDVRVAVRQIYPMEFATTQEGTSATVAALTTAVAATTAGATDSTDDAKTISAAGEAGEEEVSAFVNGMPVEDGVQRVGEWLERAARAAAEPPADKAAAEVIAAGDGRDGELSTDAAPVGAGRGGVNGGGGGGSKKRGGGRAKKAKKMTLKQALMQKGSGVSVYGPSVLEHCVLGAGLRPNVKLSGGGAKDGDGRSVDDGGGNGEPNKHWGGLSEEEVRKLVVALAGAEAAVQQLDRPGQQGYIQCKPIPAPIPSPIPAPAAAAAAVSAAVEGKTTTGGASKEEGGRGEGDVGPAEEEKQEADSVVYEEFLPQLLAQHEGMVVHAFPSFDQAVDAFFGRIVEQKLKQVTSV